jgi:hypothetical protein
MSGPGWGRSGLFSGCGSSDGVGGRTTSGLGTGIGSSGRGVVGMKRPFPDDHADAFGRGDKPLHESRQRARSGGAAGRGPSYGAAFPSRTETGPGGLFRKFRSPQAAGAGSAAP